MKYLLKINGTDCLLTHEQVNTIVETLEGCETYGEKHVGQDKGTQGYNNSYIPFIGQSHLHEWLKINVMSDDLIETIKLRMKLEAQAN